MNHFLILVGLFIISAYLASRSLSELEVPDEITEMARRFNKKRKKLWGIIVFLGKKTIHYSSGSPEPSSRSIKAKKVFYHDEKDSFSTKG